MKNLTKKLAIILVVLVMVISVVLAACEGEKHDYTVKVVGPDGKPYTSALVQPCLVVNGELDMCYEPVAVNAQGIAYLDIGKEIPSADAEEIEIHLMGLPSTLDYQSVRMHKGETKTIYITEKSSDVPNLKNPTSGTGIGSYESDVLTGEDSNRIDLDNFDPYVVGEGSYRLKFDSADQKIFYAFKANESAKYKVYSTGTVDAAVIQLRGNTFSGIFCYRGEGYENDNVSSTDYNFYYEFEVDESTIQQNGGLSYFEVSLSNPDGVGVDAVISFKYASEGQGGDDDNITDVYPENPLDEYKTVGTYVDAPVDGSAQLYKDSNGIYHLGTSDSDPVLVATLGTDEDVNVKHKGNDVTPRGLDKGFTLIVKQGASITFYEGNQGYNYYPLVTEYTASSNSEGRYPVTDELIAFLNGYLVNNYTIELLQSNLGIKLSSVNPWLVWCGYYQDPYEEEVGGGGSEADGSDEENAIMLGIGVIDVKVPEGGSVYYEFNARADVTLIIRPRTDNIKLTVYEQSVGSEGAQPLEQTEGSDGLMCYQVALNERKTYYFVFSTVDGLAENYQVVVEEASDEDSEGTSDNPIVAWLGTIEGSTRKMEGMDVESIFYSYVVQEDDNKLYFYEGNNTVIRNIYYYDSEFIARYLDITNLAKGYSIDADTLLYIEVSSVEIGSFSFIIANAPLGTADNPFVWWLGSNSISITAEGSVYCSYTAFENQKVRILLGTENASNIVLKVYVDGSDPSTAKTLELKNEDGILYFELDAEVADFMTKYILVFSTSDNSAESFDVTLAVDED